jgi:hypothetical protein
MMRTGVDRSSCEGLRKTIINLSQDGEYHSCGSGETRTAYLVPPLSAGAHVTSPPIPTFIMYITVRWNYHF